MNILKDEHVLEDDYPVYATYWYLVDELPVRSLLQGTVRDLKRRYEAKEVRRCDAVARDLPMSGWDD